MNMETFPSISQSDFRTLMLNLCCLLWSPSFLLLGFETVKAEVIAKEDFESGSLSGWTLFPTANGTLGGEGYPAVVPCDMGEMEKPSKCFQVKVGQMQYDSSHDPQQGGVLETRLQTENGFLGLSASVMVTYRSPTDRRNLAGGLFEWLVDEEVVAKHDMGPIENESTVTHRLRADHRVSAGLHVIGLRISRPFKSGRDQQAPIQFVDDLSIEFSPEP